MSKLPCVSLFQIFSVVSAKYDVNWFTVGNVITKITKWTFYWNTVSPLLECSIELFPFKRSIKFLLESVQVQVELLATTQIYHDNHKNHKRSVNFVIGWIITFAFFRLVYASLADSFVFFSDMISELRLFLSTISTMASPHLTAPPTSPDFSTFPGLHLNSDVKSQRSRPTYRIDRNYKPRRFAGGQKLKPMKLKARKQIRPSLFAQLSEGAASVPQVAIWLCLLLVSWVCTDRCCIIPFHHLYIFSVSLSVHLLRGLRRRLVCSIHVLSTARLTF